MALTRTLRCDLDTAKRVLRILDKAEWIARLPRHNAADNWIMLASPKQIALNDLYERFVLDRAEFNYQIGQSPAGLNGNVLTAALNGRHMEITLADLIAPGLSAAAPVLEPDIALQVAPRTN